MENKKLPMLAELPGLVAAQNAIEARIQEIREALEALEAEGATLVPPPARPPAIMDPTILGRDIGAGETQAKP
jgi:hypothetical protein